MVGRKFGDATVVNSYWDTEASGQTTGYAGGMGKTTAEMKRQATFEGWDFDDVWSIDEDVDYPRLRIFSSKKPQMKVTLAADTFIYNGTAKEPAVTSVSVNGQTLAPSDYVVLYGNNVRAGTAKVTVIGTGNYLGVAAENGFTITAKPLTITGVSATDRDYEAGNIHVALTGGTLVGVEAVDADKVRFTLGAGTMADDAAGEGKPVTVNIALTGEASGNYTLSQPIDITVNIDGTVSIASNDRVIPPVVIDMDAAAATPASAASFEVAAGPNPVPRDAGVVRFFAGATDPGRPPLGIGNISGQLTIYDAQGNVVRKISVNAGNAGFADVRTAPRAIAEWDLRDGRGRAVSAGTYLVRGALTVNDKREKVSIMIGVR